MSRDKQISEMATKMMIEVNRAGNEISFKNLATALYNAGYLKSTDLAEEIFAEIENAHEECIHIDPSTNIGYLLQTKFEHKLAELKKKYIVTDTNVGCKESEKDNG